MVGHLVRLDPGAPATKNPLPSGAGVAGRPEGVLSGQIQQHRAGAYDKYDAEQKKCAEGYDGARVRDG